jgi:N-acetylmuramoyl-L-alanine amidase
MAIISNVSGRFLAGAALLCAIAGAPATAAAQPPRELYTSALVRERALRDGERPPAIRQIRDVVEAYERLVRRYPTSGYSDNALWQAGNLSLLAYQRFGQSADRRTGLRLLNQLKASYPASSLLDRFDEVIGEFDSEPAVNTALKAPVRPATPAPGPVRAPVAAAGPAPAPPAAAAASSADSVAAAPSRPVENSSELVAIRAISRTPLEDGLRVSIEMDGEATYHQERLDNPRRVFFDVRNARPVASLIDATLKYPDEPVQEIRLGRRPQNTTRVVMEMNGTDSVSVFTLYNPYRVVVDFHRIGAPVATTSIPRLPPLDGLPLKAGATTPSTRTARNAVGAAVPTPSAPPPPPPAPPAPIEKLPLPSRAAVPPALSAPTVPSANSNGRFSIARQLGLGVSRVVIDAGHGGHDPGAHGNGVDEAELVLDVALRLRRLLADQPGMEVVMTRDTDVFIPLEERTAIANRESADLFLSIHANASRNAKASGIETYFLNFASNPEAAAVAARENSASGKTMHSLPEIVRAITLNNKIDESRDFADLVQKAMVKKLTVKNAALKDLGVKQAPFVVLIGAGMPSVLAEISFVTHKQEGQLLKTTGYRQQIAEALFEAVQGYQRSLKARNAIAAREE